MPSIIIHNATLDDVTFSMKKMVADSVVDSSIRKLAEEITRNAYDKPSAIFVWVQRNFKYAMDPNGLELFISPKRFAEDYYNGQLRMGDCDDHALLNSALLRSLGYETRILLVDADLDGGVDHALAQVKLENKWENFDTVRHPSLGWHEDWKVVMVIE